MHGGLSLKLNELNFFFFAINGFIINKFVLFLFDVSSSGLFLLILSRVG
jgi:hypothetical protein